MQKKEIGYFFLYFFINNYIDLYKYPKDQSARAVRNNYKLLKNYCNKP